MDYKYRYYKENLYVNTQGISHSPLGFPLDHRGPLFLRARSLNKIKWHINAYQLNNFRTVWLLQVSVIQTAKSHYLQVLKG